MAGRWRQRSLQGRVLLLLAVLVTVVVVGAGSIIYTLDLQRLAVDQANGDRELLYRVQQLDAALESEDVALKAFLLTGEPSFLDSVDRFGEQAHLARGRVRDGSLRAVDQRWHAWGAWGSQARADVVGGRVPPSGATSEGGDTHFELLMAAVQAAEQRAEDAGAKAAASARDQQDRLRLTTLAATAIGLVMVALIASAFFHWTLAPIKRLVDAARALAAGESVVIPESASGGEIGQLARALAEWERASRERLTLAQAMVEVGTETDLERVIAGGSERLRAFLDAAVVSVTVAGSGSGGASRILMPGNDWDQFQPELYAASPSHRAIQSRIPVATDLRLEVWPEAIQQFALHHDLGPTLAVPLLSAGELIGVVTLVRRGTGPMFTAAEVQRAELMVQPLAVAMRVATLFEQLRRANDELAAASRHKSEFLATMSHELRTPLNSILGFSQLLESSDFGDLNDRQLRYVDHIHSSGKHLLALINDVLDLSKVEAGQLELAIERVNLEEAVDQCLAKMRPQGDAKRLRLRSEGLSGVAVRADPRRLQQVLLNLLSNAVKFTPEEGEVKVSAGSAGDEVLISVRDNGVGIPTEDLERVFEQFIQLRSGRTRSQEGTGLGLALSRRLLALMGGSIEVHSQIGKGSVFTIRLPQAPGPARSRPSVSRAALAETHRSPTAL